MSTRFGSKLGFLTKGIQLLVEYKLSSPQPGFDAFLLDRIRSCQRASDASFAIRLFLSEKKLECLGRVGASVPASLESLPHHQLASIIASMIWMDEDPELVATAITYLPEDTQWAYRAALDFYQGRLSEEALRDVPLPLPKQSGEFTFVADLFEVYCLTARGGRAEAETKLREVIRAYPHRFVEFQERFERTGYREYHIE